MNRAAASFYARVQRRTANLEPAVRKAILKSFENVRAILPEGTVIKLIKSGQLDQLIDKSILDRAFIPTQRELRTALENSFRSAIRDMPKGGEIAGLQAVAFDHLNPDVIRAIRTLETNSLDTLKSNVQVVVREAVRRGLEEGRAVGSIARELRSVIGLAPNQLDAVSNFRSMLEAGDREALSRSLRDRRFDGTLDRALGADGEGLTADQIDRMVGRYQDNFVAFNASVNARAATVDAYKTGQLLSWQEADAKGVIPDGYTLMKEWIGIGDERERPEHVAMNGQIVPADQPYSNGQMTAGEGDFNCRCVDRFFLQKDGE